jgi:hypothetical protein
MKSLAVVTVVLFMAGITAVNAQVTSRQMDEQAGGNSQASSEIRVAQLVAPR